MDEVSRKKGFTPETRLLLCCARRRLEPRHVTRIRRLVGGGLAWSRLLDQAWDHALLPLLHHHLGAVDAPVPPRARAAMRGFFVRNAAHAMGLAAELRALLDGFNRAGITALPYKGPVLAEMLYGNLALRQMADLDVLVRQADFSRAREVLLSSGYRPRSELSPASERLLRKAYCNQVFERPGSAQVELHWRFTNPAFAFDLDLDRLAPRLLHWPLGGGEVPALAAEDLLLVLSVHGSKHEWSRLEWLTGIAEVARSAPGLDWDLLLRRASDARSARKLLLGLVLAQELLEAPVPPEMARRARADRQIPLLARAVAMRLAAPRALQPQGKLSLRLFQLRLLEGPRDRARFLAHLLARSDEIEDWRFLRVGNRHLPLHGLLRPFQATRKVGRRLLEDRAAEAARDRGRGIA